MTFFGGAKKVTSPLGLPQGIIGVQVSVELNLGTRTVLEYLLSPIQKTVAEAGRER